MAGFYEWAMGHYVSWEGPHIHGQSHDGHVMLITSQAVILDTALY